MILMRQAQGKEANHPKPRYPINVLYDVMCEKAGKNPFVRETLAFRCLEDRERTIRLMGIVSDTVQSFCLHGAEGMDVGAGCGPLAFSFLNAGGGSVTAIEICPELCQLMERIAERLGFSRRISIRKKNVHIHRIDPMPEAMLVMCEMVGTGLITEGLVSAIRRIRAKVNPGALYLPEAIESRITLKSEKGAVSEPCVYDRVDLPGEDRDGVDKELAIRLSADDPVTIIGADIDTKLFYPNGDSTGRYQWLCDTFEEMLKEPVTVQGKDLRLRIKYNYGASDSSDCGIGIRIR